MTKGKNLMLFNTLGEKEAKFLTLFMAGVPEKQCLERAGYSPNCAVATVLAGKRMQEAINYAVRTEIMTTGKRLAWATIKELMVNKKVNASVRFQAARFALEASGEGAKTAEKAQATKEIHEMTAEELREFIDKAKRVVDATCVDVTPQTGANTPQAQESIDIFAE